MDLSHNALLFLSALLWLSAASLSVHRKSESTTVNFIVMGDWGGLPIFPHYSPFEKRTAYAMAETAKLNHSEYVFALGDNFYYNGVVNEFDPRFQTTFEKVFHQQSLTSIDWFIVAGNHDHYGNITGQLAYSRHSSRWNFPKLWYQVLIERPSFNITIIMIDTVVLCGNTLEDRMHSQPLGAENTALANEQLMYIETALKNASKSHYVLVMGHFPVYSIAEHGPTQCLIDMLDPLLVKYGASAYMNGHDHNLQHIQNPASGMNYFVTGAVDVVDPNKDHIDNIPEGSLMYHFGDILGLGGYATVAANENMMTVDFHDAASPDKILYRYDIKPRK